MASLKNSKIKSFQLLKKCIQEYRGELIKDRRTCLNILYDFGGKGIYEVEILADLVSLEVPKILLTRSAWTHSQIISLANEVSTQSGWNQRDLTFAVAAWADALGFCEIDPTLLYDLYDKQDHPEAKWFVLQNDKTIGPFTREQIENQIALHEIDTEALVWTEGMSNWIEARRAFSAHSWHPPPTPPSIPEDQHEEAKVEVLPLVESTPTDSNHQPAEQKQNPNFFDLCASKFTRRYMLGLLIMFMFTSFNMDESKFLGLFFCYSLLYYFCCALRLKNIGWSPWLALLLLVPFVNIGIIFSAHILPKDFASKNKK